MNFIRLVIFDWAGTTIDHGSRSPLAAFVEAFAHQSVEVTVEQAKAPMGLHKKDHIRSMLETEQVAEKWRFVHDRDWNDQDVDTLYQEYTKLQLESIGNYCKLVPGLIDCVATLQSMNIHVGATTGYFRDAAEHVYKEAGTQGYFPDCTLCADEVPMGRPAPWMIFRIMEALGVYPPAAVVKVGDTVHDIAEGLNAGVWTVGVTRSGAYVGCTEEEWEALADEDKQRKLDEAEERLLDAGAHFVIETIADVPQVLEQISQRLAAQ